ncbi:tRNA synthetases class I (M)-domain-containing protein [Dunaliella salina]|uniref:methionine--tRNA ligase n=1 Tax=Dunaliella salina TaxID=3046 RepID=A0ABQ7H1I4_DUNSA|nr:tRNA synthetases class I (M)-domain-containing protein [Dunaliella salina]|eukprot:KAF5840719.1 tRNA synthetases class I (M)-domain-containing protein [Dunaliella salina]
MLTRSMLSKSIKPFGLRAPPRVLRSLHTAVRCSADHSDAKGDNYTITTPLYYVNAAPHMGSAYSTIAADTAARFQRLKGRHVRFVTGTDEHGEKIAAAALSNGMSPQQHCDHIVGEYETLWGQLDIAYDAFIRTTSSKHEKLVHETLKRVWEKGDIYLSDYEGWYCVGCEEFKDEKEMDAQHNCPTHLTPCQHRKEANYFFRLSRYQKEIEELLTKEAGFVRPESRRNELVTWVKDGVRDFSISRSAVQWGISIPNDPVQTVYVWFDALIGYLSGLIPEGAEPSLAKVKESGWPASVHIIGKDILRFHAIYWPGMLLSADLPLPKQVYGHGFLTKNGMKMGKALGNTLDPKELVSDYGSDAVRFYFMKEIIFGQDGDFSDERFRNTVNAALANNIGNMLNRSLNLLKKFCKSEVTIDLTADIPPDHQLRQLATEKMPAAHDAYERLALHEAIDACTSLCAQGNQFLERTEPWHLFKGDEAQKAQAVTAICAVLETLRIVAVALKPVVPQLSMRIYQQLGYSPQQFQDLTWHDTAWGGLPKGQLTSKPVPVFARLEAKELEAAVKA